MKCIVLWTEPRLDAVLYENMPVACVKLFFTSPCVHIPCVCVCFSCTQSWIFASASYILTSGMSSIASISAPWWERHSTTSWRIHRKRSLRWSHRSLNSSRKSRSVHIYRWTCPSRMYKSTFIDTCSLCLTYNAVLLVFTHQNGYRRKIIESWKC